MRLKLLYPPRNHGEGGGGPSLSRIPLIGLPTLKAIAEKRGLRTDIDDLDMLAQVHNSTSKRPIDLGPFLDKARVRRHLAGDSDDELEESVIALLNLTKLSGYDLIGFSITDEWNFSCQASALLLSRALRMLNGCLTVAGGPDVGCLRVNFTNDELLSCLDMVSFEPVHTASGRLLELCHALTSVTRAPEEPFRGAPIVNNYGYESPPILLGKRLADMKERLSNSPEQGLDPLESIARPDFRGLPLEHYVTLPEDIRKNLGLRRGILVLPYTFSLGCPFGCAFCGCSISSAKKTFYVKTPSEIAEDLGYLSKRYRTRYFQLMNPNINPTKEFAWQLVGEIKGLNTDFMLSDCANLRQLDAPLLSGLRDIGVRRLIYGVESPHDAMLSYIEKGITLDHIKRTLRLADKVGIWNEAEVICGLPFETPKIVESIISFMTEFRTVINYYWVHKFKLLQSRMMQFPERYGLENVRRPPQPDVQGWAFDEKCGLSWEEKYRQIQWAYQSIFKLAESFSSEDGTTHHDESLIRLFMLYAQLDSKREVLHYLKTTLGQPTGGS